MNQHPVDLSKKRCDIVAGNILRALNQLSSESPEQIRGTFAIIFTVDEDGHYNVMRPPSMTDDAYRLFIRQVIDHIETRRVRDSNKLIEVPTGFFGGGVGGTA